MSVSSALSVSPRCSAFELVPLRGEHEAAVTALHEEVFGPGRYARTAYRVRREVSHHADLSLVALIDGQVRGANWQTRVVVGQERGVLLGPLAVHPACKGQGIGRALLAASLELACAAGAAFVVLVGDAPYYERAGFVRLWHQGVIWPGPVDAARVLIYECETGVAARLKGRLYAVQNWN